MTRLCEFQSIKERDIVFDRKEKTSFNDLLAALKNDQGENVFFVAKHRQDGGFFHLFSVNGYKMI
jgi:hypothetical protein